MEYLQVFLDEINRNIQLTLEIEQTRRDFFLDIEIIKNNDNLTIDTKIFSKEIQHHFK